MILKKEGSLIFSDSLFKNASYLMANSIFGNITGFVFWLIAAKIHTAQDVGLASTVISSIGLLALISNLGFSISLIRFLPDYKDKVTNLINSCFTISASMAVILSGLFICFIDTFSPELFILNSNILYTAGFILFTCLTTISSLMDIVFVGFRKSKLSFIKMTIQSILKIPVILVLSFMGSSGIVASYGIAYLVAVLIASFILIPMVNPNYLPIPCLDLQLLKKIYHYSAGNYIASIFETLPSLILPIFVLNTLSSEMTAYFYMAWMIAGVVFIIPKAIATSLFAEGSHNESILEQNVVKYLKITAELVIPAIVLMALIGSRILLIFGENYLIYGEKLLLVLLISAFPMIFNEVYIAKKRVQNNITVPIIIYLVIATTTMIIGFLTIDKLGIMSIGVGWFIGQTVSLVYICILNTTYIRHNLKTSLFKIKK